MTSNYKQFEKDVIEKCGSMSNFSHACTGSFMTFQGLRNTKDHQRIERLKEELRALDFRIETVEISQFDRDIIKARMDFIVETRQKQYDNLGLYKAGKWLKYKKSDWRKENKVSDHYWHSLMGGALKFKNLAYERLIKLMGL